MLANTQAVDQGAASAAAIAVTRVTLVCGLGLGIVAAILISRGVNRVMRSLSRTLAEGSAEMTHAAEDIRTSSSDIAEATSAQAASLAPRSRRSRA